MSTTVPYRVDQKSPVGSQGSEIITNPQNSGEGKRKEGGMKPVFEDHRPACPKDRIDGRTIILDSGGEFPKKLIILEADQAKEYQIIKTRKGGYLLN